MTAALQSLQDQYDLLTNSLPRLLQACQGDTGKEDAINTQYNLAAQNYFNCVNKIFDDNDAGVKALVAQMKQEQAALSAQVTRIGNIAGVIKAITTAVQTGVSLAAKV